MILDSFSIYGLHGYKNVDLEFNSDVKILIAENGSGKTAVLKILNDFLNLDLISLRDAKFNKAKLFLNLQNTLFPSELEIKKELIEDSINYFRNNVSKNLILKLSSIGFEEIFQFITQEYNEFDFEDLIDHYIIEHLFKNTPLNFPEIEELLEGIQLEINELALRADNPLLNIYQNLAILHRRYSLNFLPTYRRIEAPCKTFLIKNNLDNEEKKIVNSINFTKHMRFGLPDVSDSIKRINKIIYNNIYTGFMALSFNYIKYTLGGVSLKKHSLPKIEDIERLFKRAPQFEKSNEDVISLLKEAYENDTVKNNKDLIIFLNQINEIIKKTSYQENKIRRFVEAVNNFLSVSGEEKYLAYDSDNFNVSVKLAYSNEDISFEDLSSGEKQIIGLLSSLYFEDKPQLMLIDEPEISLSIKWQRMLLPELYKANPANQIICITHSPFIFENNFDSKASPLYFKRNSEINNSLRFFKGKRN